MMQGKINRGRHTDNPAGRHSISTNQCLPPPIPPFLQAGCPSCRPTNSVKALKANLQHVIRLNTVGSRWYNGSEIQLVHRKRMRQMGDLPWYAVSSKRWGMGNMRNVNMRKSILQNSMQNALEWVEQEMPNSQTTVDNGQLADMPTRGLVKSWTSQVVDWSTRRWRYHSSTICYTFL